MRPDKGNRSFATQTYLALYGLAIAIPLLVVLGAMVFRAASLEREQLERRILQVLDDLVDEIDRDIDRHVTILKTLATSQALKNQDWPAFYEQAKAGLQGRAYLILIDANGRQVVNTYLPYGEQPATTGDPETLQRILQIKGSVVSNLFTSLAVKKPVFNISIPVMQNGQVRFIMSLGLLPDDLEKVLSGQKLGSAWVTLIWDANGIILARSADNARYLGTSLPAHLREQSPRALVRTTNLDGTDVLHVTRRSEISGWGFGVNVSYAQISQQLRTSLLISAAATVLAVMLAIGLGGLFARRITKPLSLATEAASALGHGKPITITGSRLKEADVFLKTLGAAEQELAERAEELKRAEEQFRLAVEAAPNGMVLSNRDGEIILINTQIEKMFGYRRDELVGQNIDMLVPERFRERHLTDRGNYISRPSVRLMGTGRDVFARRKDGTEVPVEIGLSPIVTSQGTMALCGIVDITDRMKAQEGQQLVIRELQHRTQNLLTVVQTVANRSLDEAKTFAEAKFVMNGRLKALGKAYATLSEAKWTGASLREIIDQQLAPMLNRITVNGCDIIVIPTAAQQFAMIVHELTTNALKYGALSAPEGRVSIEGMTDRRSDDGVFLFTWTEIGGPVVSPPSRKGFGSVILIDSARQFGETVNADYLATGLVYSLQVRLSTVEAKSTGPLA